MELIGIPYKLNGRDKNGVDCLGLLKLWINEKGYTCPQFPNLPEKLWFKNSPNEVISCFNPFIDKFTIEANYINIDNVIFFKASSEVLNHIGIICEGNRFLHVLENHGVVRSYLHYKWKLKIVGIRRILWERLVRH